MREDLQQQRDRDAATGLENGGELEQSGEQDRTQFTTRGSIPSVAADGPERRSASDLADGGARLGGSWGGLLDGASGVLDSASDLLGGAKNAPEAKATNGLFGSFFGDDEKKQAPTMKSSTVFKASGAGSSRTKVAVGEPIALKGSAAGTWSMTGGGEKGAGTLQAPKGGSTEAYWNAPSRAGTVTISLDVDGQKVSKDFEVVEPGEHGIHYHHFKRVIFDPGTAGAGMKMTMSMTPSDVSFAAIEVQEVGHDANGRSGYFSTGDVRHKPHLGWTSVNQDNRLLDRDTADMKLDPGGYSKGNVLWHIPHNFRVKGEADLGKYFTKVTQTFDVDAEGTCKVTKDGESVERKIEEDDGLLEQQTEEATEKQNAADAAKAKGKK